VHVNQCELPLGKTTALQKEGHTVCDSKKPRVSFPLRLAASLKERAEKLAAIDGVSINHFINLAVAEKVSRLEAAKNDTK
jgi:predicted HicB family RNase H-like nuclease